MITPEEIKQIAATGEGYNAEFKISVPSKVRDIAEEVCAFANSAGGTLLIGVHDKTNAILGATIDNAKRSAIQDAIGNIDPTLNCNLEVVNVDGMDVGVVEVASGPRKPYVLSGAIFVRNGPNTQRLTTVEEMRDFFQQSDRIYFDETPCNGFDIDTQVDEGTVKEFRAAGVFSAGVSDEQLFQNLRLYATEGGFKNGAVLFFGKDPSQYFEKAILRCVAFEGKDKRFIIDDKPFSGPLVSQYHQCMAWLKGRLDIRYDIEGAGGGPRKEIWEIPETALKEAIINALAHRDYYDRGAFINVEVFDDRVEISNPGGLVSVISEKEFGKRSHSRNPLVFGLFARMRLVEQVGSGVGRIRDLMEEAGLTAPEFNTKGMFSIILRRPFDFEKWVNKWVDNLSENRLAIIRAIHKDAAITKKELEAAVGIGATAIDNNLEYLKSIGLLERIGTKGGKWVIRFIDPEVGK